MIKSEDLEEGLDFILLHLDDPKSEYGLFPRRISTNYTSGAQIMVDSKEEALEYFYKADLLDCRISAYPYVEFHPPNFIFIDLDLSTFKSKKSLDKALENTLKKIESINAYPTVLFTGNGYHIYLPMDCVNEIKPKEHRENEIESSGGLWDELNRDINGMDVNLTNLVLKFAEQYLSNYTSDPNHNPTIKSCLLRIPNSINSKNNKKVEIKQRWNGFRPNIAYILPEFHYYLIEKKKEEEEKHFEDYGKIEKIYWIERLLGTPIEDSRTFATWKIICPYLLNVKHLSKEQCKPILRNWLLRCADKKRLSKSVESYVRHGINSANGYKPLSMDKLKIENKYLYDLIIDD